jgi:hypothetical protein
VLRELRQIVPEDVGLAEYRVVALVEALVVSVNGLASLASDHVRVDVLGHDLRHLNITHCFASGKYMHTTRERVCCLLSVYLYSIQ